MNILITGASGLVGQRLVPQLKAKGHNVRTLSHQKGKGDFYWDREKIDTQAFEEVDVIIHLAGASISHRWTPTYKKLIHSSRIDTANLLFKYAKDYAPELRTFISASGSSYYGQVTSDRIFEEEDPAGSDFLAQICVDWEKAAYQFQALGTRVVCLRTSMVLSQQGGALDVLKKPFKVGLGTNLGTGKQWMPWIHLEDLCGLYIKAVEDDTIKGNYNAVSPAKLNQDAFNRQLADSLNRPFILPSVPAFFVRTGLGEMSDLILKGSRLSTSKVEKSGYRYIFPDLKEALADLI